MKSNMTIPSRPAPAPPTQNSNTQFSAQPSRYTPTTNWDDSPFTVPPTAGANVAQPTRVKKPPPPRPPPPKISQSTSLPALKKPVQSVNILSNIFGSSKNKQAANNQRLGQSAVPPKLPAPPPTNHHHHNRYQSTATTQQSTAASHADQQLISFDSPPDSPTLTQKSNPNSDCVSIDSFSSDSNYSSPHNESASQAESGFEDDFSVQSRSSSAGPRPWEVADPFSQPPQKLPNPPKATPKPPAPVSTKSKSLGGLSFFGKSTPKRPPVDEFLDPLDNGNPIMKGPPPGPRMPTIIKPPKAKAKPQPQQKPKPEPSNFTILSETFAQESLDDSLPEPPMPSIPPPPPPPAEYLESLDDLSLDAVPQETESYGIALYDYNGEQVDDLNFKANEKIYLVRQINEEWLFGRNRRGCEGMFPANYVDIQIPILPGQGASCTPAAGVANKTTTTASAGSASTMVRALYDFNAETMEDLTIKENEMITVMYQINAEWLYGRNQSNMFGQFPANFIEFVPPNLPTMP